MVPVHWLWHELILRSMKVSRNISTFWARCQTHLKSTEVVIMFILWRRHINSAFKLFVTLSIRRENVCVVWMIEWHLLAVRKWINLEKLSDMLKFSSWLITSCAIIIFFLFACLNFKSKIKIGFPCKKEKSVTGFNQSESLTCMIYSINRKRIYFIYQ